jgi:hypothetical protein
MSGRDPPRLSNPDDWFGDVDPVAPASSRATSAPEALAFEHQGPGAADDWLDGERAATRPEGPAGFTVKLRTLLAAAAIVVVLIVLAGLELGGAFSGSGKHPATNPTTATTITTTQTPTTTPIAPARPAARALSAPTSTLKPGAQGAQVKLLQRALKRLGYSAGVVDGVYGPSTQAALVRFQKASALATDGVLGPKTLQAIKRALRQ